ncbi:DgyrCDS3645 [Dimorphilus gyrociliatus]|nr:DgyrCDS3645 [Dimorphilus gyrociliatus]
MLQTFATLPFSNPDGGVWKQGWDITYSPSRWTTDRPLKVFVIPHSHNDPGWIKTFDRYFQDQTRHILDNMVQKLEQHSKMTFIYAEMSFFSTWWSQQNDATKEKVKRFLNEGRLELPTAGWVMTDEANSHYSAMLDQLIEGNNWLFENVGVRPDSAWSIDPFGQSSTMAYLLKKTGFKNMLIQRVHYTIKKYLAEKSNLEFMWRQNWDLSGKTDMFCHMMPFYSYDVPHTCGPDPKICCQYDFKRLPGGKIACPWRIAPVPITDGNVAQKAETLLDQYRKKASLYKSDVVLIPLGDDFRYDKPDEWDNQYNNYQKLFDYMNAKSDWHVEAKFGTLRDYFEALANREKVKRGERPDNYPILGGDFFTYADRDDHYWSGYFTSRPFYKRMDRIVEAHLRAAEIAYSLARIADTKKSIFDSDKNMAEMLTFSRRSLALFQHHDAITGTEKDFVVVDYAMKLLKSLENTKKIIQKSTEYLMSDGNDVFTLDETRQSQDSIPEKQIIKLSSANERYVVFYNSLASNRSVIVSIWVNSPYAIVKNEFGQIIQSQCNPVWTNNEQYSTDQFKLLFVVTVGGLGMVRYSIEKAGRGENQLHSLAKIYFHSSGNNYQKIFDYQSDRSDVTLENREISIKISRNTGTLQEIKNKLDDITSQVKVEFIYYGTRGTKEKSGAYLFLPDGLAKQLSSPSVFVRSTKGPLSSEVNSFMKNVEHKIRVENAGDMKNLGVEIENIVDIRSEQNYELGMRIVTDIQNEDNEYFTDLNGFQMQKRRYFSKIPLQGNFYPMATMAYMEDKNKRFTVLTGQSLGCASLHTGWLEIMQDRRMKQDDNRGLGQGVLDNKRTPHRFRFLLEKRISSGTNAQSTGFASLTASKLSDDLIHSIFVLPAKSSINSPQIKHFVTTLNQPLNCELHAVNLRSDLKNRNNYALILHRTAPNCGFKSRGLFCTPGGGKINLGKLFSASYHLSEVKTTSLNLLWDDKPIEFNKLPVEIAPMELEVFKLTFSS